uniref:TAF domain-containing protein n=1 Tax=Angiostrongylus cantonensis TaxID=6313 RepID=A0A0K0D8W2_ANGCA
MTSQNYSTFTEPFSPGIQVEYVRTVGDSLGVVNLTPAAFHCLADKLTELLIRCSKTARKLAIHGRRRTVLVDDVQNALRMMNITVIPSVCLHG